MPTLTIRANSAAGIFPDASSDFTEEDGFSLSGSLIAGQTLTIGGTGFGTKPGTTAGPLFFWDFGSGSMSLHSASRGTFSGSNTWATDFDLTTAKKATNRTHSIVAGVGNPDPQVGPMNTEADGQSDKLWVFQRYHFNFDGLDIYPHISSWNIKNLRYWGGTYSGASPYLMSRAYGGINRDDGNPRFNGGQTSGFGQYYIDGDTHGIHKNVWQEEEFRVQHDSGAGTQTASAWTVTSGIEQAHEDNPTQERASGEAKMRDLYTMHFQDGPGVPTDQGFEIAFDTFYVEDSWCRILIVDGATWSDTVAHSREPQIPLTWANGQITFEFRPGIFGSDLTGKTLYVVTNTNTKIKIGAFA